MSHFEGDSSLDVRKVCAAALVALALAGCATTTPPEPVVITKEVLVPVAVDCVPKTLGPPPKYADSKEALLAAPGPEDRYQLLAAGREQRIARLGEVEPVITNCRTK